MSDPAVEAARRAFSVLWPDQGTAEFNFMRRQRSWAILTAREVLIVAWPSIKKAVELTTLAHATSVGNQVTCNRENCGCASRGIDAALSLADAINDSIFSELFPEEILGREAGL